MYDLSSIMTCTLSIELFTWMYQVRKQLDPFFIITEMQYKSYYFPTHPNEHPSGLLTKDVWGAYFWKAIHHLAKQHYPTELLSSTFSSLFQILPCNICKKHALEYITTHPLVMNPRDHFEWTVIFHNEVSRRVNETYGTRKKIYQLIDASKL